MTRVARCARVTVSRLLRVLWIHKRLCVGVAIQTGIHRVVAGIGVAIRTERPLLRMPTGIDSEILLVVIKGRRNPGRSRMTRLASMTEVPGHMVRVRRAFKIQLMALIAARISQLIIVANVTILTLRRCVPPGEREIRGVMLERRRLPGCGRVTLHAVRRKTALHVIRIERRVEIRLMAPDALRRLAFVHMVAMAIRAW